jgi:hypothetical protein
MASTGGFQPFNEHLGFLPSVLKNAASKAISQQSTHPRILHRAHNWTLYDMQPSVNNRKRALGLITSFGRINVGPAPRDDDELLHASVARLINIVASREEGVHCSCAERPQIEHKISPRGKTRKLEDPRLRLRPNPLLIPSRTYSVKQAASCVSDSSCSYCRFKDLGWSCTEIDIKAVGPQKRTFEKAQQ